MLRFQLHQLYLPSLGRYFLPLPKLSDSHLAGVSAHLVARGFNVRTGSGPSKLAATKGTQRIAVDGLLGLAGSSADMLDALAPAIPALIASKRTGSGLKVDVAERYFSLKRSGALTKLHLFPRLESLRKWTCLRRDRLSGLTPDEAAVLRHLLGKASRSLEVGCVTAMPRQGSRPLQVGRNLYYRSVVPVAEFLSSMATIDSGGGSSACYLPRDSVLSIPRVRVDVRISADELGDWCLFG